MRLNQTLIEAMGKKLETGCPAKHAIQAEGIHEATFYRWKAEGEEIFKKVTDKDGEYVPKEYGKLNETQKLKCEVCESIRTSIAKGHAVLVAITANGGWI